MTFEDCSILQLLVAYRKACKLVMTKLIAQYDISDPLRAVVTGQIPRQVLFSDGSELRFHGIGCSFGSSELSVSFDFGPNGRYDGFNAGLLAEFAAENQISQLTYSEIDAEVVRLLNSGQFVKPCWHPGVDLIYLSEDVTMS